MAKKLLTLLFALLLIPLSAQAQSINSYEGLIDTVSTYGTDYSLEQANAFIAQNPNVANAYAWRALLHHELGDMAAANADIDEGLAVEETALLHAVRGLFIMETGDNRAAFQSIDKALAFGTGDLHALHIIAQAYILDTRYGEASNLINYIIQNGATADFYLTRANVALIEGRTEDALADLNTAVEQFAGNPNVYIARAGFFEDAGDTMKALEDYNVAIRLDKWHATPYARRGLLLAGFNDFTAALDDFNRAIMFAPNDAEIYANRGITYIQMGDIQAALTDLNTAIDMNNSYGLAYFWRGTLNRDMGNIDAAIADFTNAIDNDPGLLDVYAIRGELYMATEQYAAAASDFATLFDNMDAEPSLAALTNYATALSMSGEYTSAEQIFSDGLALDQFNIDLLLGRAQTRFELGRYDEALADTQVLLSLDPDFEAAYQLQLAIYEATGDTDNANAVQAILDDLS